MKKVIIAMEDCEQINSILNKEGIYKKVQYREAILETLENQKDINEVIIDEKIIGQISIEDLINKIKLINKKVNIIFFLEKNDINKKNKLKKLGINNIYIINKNDNKKSNNNKNKKRKHEKKKEVRKTYDQKNLKKLYYNEKIITVCGERKAGKTTIVGLIISKLIKKDNKVLIINLNKNIEKDYFICLKNKPKGHEIEINQNIFLLNNFLDIYEKTKINNKKQNTLKYLLKEYSTKYDYIVFDIGTDKYKNIIKEIIENSYKNIIVFNYNIYKIKKYINIYYKNNKIIEFIIIQNKYKNNSISTLILKNIFKNIKIYKILYSKSLRNLIKKIFEGKEIKISILTKRKIEKVIS